MYILTCVSLCEYFLRKFRTGVQWNWATKGRGGCRLSFQPISVGDQSQLIKQLNTDRKAECNLAIIPCKTSGVDRADLVREGFCGFFFLNIYFLGGEAILRPPQSPGDTTIFLNRYPNAHHVVARGPCGMKSWWLTSDVQKKRGDHKNVHIYPGWKNHKGEIKRTRQEI